MASRSREVLLIASDPATREEVREALGVVPLTLREARSGREGLEEAQPSPPDLMLVDMLLQDVTGLGLCRMVREHPTLREVALVLLSSFDHEIDRILAFEIGVDDFVAKPFFRRELASRVGAILRRAEGTSADRRGPMRGAWFDMDPQRGHLEVAGRRIDLTPKEFDVLSVLVRNAGRVLSRERIVSEVWGRRSGDPRVVDAHVKSIRRKLGEASEALQTVRGVGFRFSPREGGHGDAGAIAGADRGSPAAEAGGCPPQGGAVVRPTGRGHSRTGTDASLGEPGRWHILEAAASDRRRR